MLTSVDPKLSLAAQERLVVKQVKEWGEILTGFETKNKYAVQSERGEPLFLAAEEAGGVGAVLLRMMLKAKRPFSMTVFDPQGAPVLKLSRPFRFIFDRLEIQDASGRPLGAVQKKWSWVRRIYEVEDATGHVVAELFGPILKPWTFEIRLHGQKEGQIQKRWTGLGKEMFTDADNFGVELSPLVKPEERVLILGAVFLIDFVHFENSD